MTRIAARELSVLIVYALGYSAETTDEVLENWLSDWFFSSLSGETPLFDSLPGDQSDYIRRVVNGVDGHLPELDGYIEKYSVGWGFNRLPRITVSVLRVCMFEILYMSGEIPSAAAINAAVEIARKYEDEEIVKFINGILGSFSRKELSR